MSLVFKPEVAANVVLCVLNSELNYHEELSEKKLSRILYLIETAFVEMTHEPLMGIYFEKRSGNITPLFLDENGNEKKILDFLKDQGFKGKWVIKWKQNRPNLMTTKKPEADFLSTMKRGIINEVLEKARGKTVGELEKRVIKTSRVFRAHMENYGRIL